jgi:hypothetical protein
MLFSEVLKRHDEFKANTRGFLFRIDRSFRWVATLSISGRSALFAVLSFELHPCHCEPASPSKLFDPNSPAKRFGKLKSASRLRQRRPEPEGVTCTAARSFGDAPASPCANSAGNMKVAPLRSSRTARFVLQSLRADFARGSIRSARAAARFALSYSWSRILPSITHCFLQPIPWMKELPCFRFACARLGTIVVDPSHKRRE